MTTRSNTEELILDMEHLMVKVGQSKDLMTQFEQDPLTVLTKVFPEKSVQLRKTWDLEIEKGIKDSIKRAKKVEPGPLQIFPFAIAAGAYVACSWAAKKWWPFGFSEHPMLLKEEIIKELLRKQVISKEDLIQEGHSGL